MIRTLKRWLKFLARLTLKKYRPFVIGVTGSAGKTSTKIAIHSVLKIRLSVRMAGGNLNNELGLPLAVLGNYDRTGGGFFWFGVFLKSLLALAIRLPYPRNLILEYGADKPGDIGYLLKIVKPDLAVITALGEVPVHVEFYSSPEEVAQEKGKLIQGLGVSSHAVLNHDDHYVLSLKEKTRAKVMTFGFGEGSDMRIVSFENREENFRPIGISFKLEHENCLVPVRIDGLLGQGHAYALAAAALVGLIRGLNLVEVAELLSEYAGEKGRMKILSGIKGAVLIDDSYNASPISVRSALATLQSLSAKRRVAVLGDMAELGQYTADAHEEVGRLSAKFVDWLVTVGPKAKFIAEAALAAGLAKERVLSFGEAEEAGLFLKTLIKEGDVVLIKGSQSVRMEKAIKEIMAEPRLAKKLLVRQYGKWIRP
ncbi:MAG TPA: UDP-N-acetylmuramoyl-tripeptide--D-alanyl-D-alanine ligase [Candidatus Tyrphobacter sp.]|nr:UDP-N-acetylmuramoyl-tripeptide--D-alanyl-D-alanine ligase [Candidatus Tyrphobacter sp.]